ncbi:MAG: hypothetical protein ACXVBE_02585, partial [Bdellovibrionota bacterium]
GALAACQDNFAKANVLAKMAAKGSLVADPAVLASEDVQKILQKFEKNFGVNKEDYISRMLAAHGSQDELKDMLSSKFTADKFEKMMAGAGEVKPAGDIPNESGVSEAATTGASKKIDTSLRDSLKKKLQDSRTLASLKTNPPSEKPFYKLTNLKPNGLDALVNGNQEQETELTLFDIIRLKLREYTVKERL